MKFYPLFCLTVFASINIEPSSSTCEIITINSCNYTVICAGTLERVKNSHICGASHYVTFVITKSVAPILSKTFFSSTNFDPRVREFSAFDNVWTTIDSGAFIYYQNCIEMDLSNNQITTIESQAFDYLRYLHVLNLSRNSIKKLNPHSFSIQSNNIEVLDLSYNELTTLNNEFNDLSKLTKLYLQNNKLESISDNTFLNLEELNYLYLQRNQLKTFNITLTNLTKLVSLDLSDNYLVQLSGFELNSFGSIRLSHVNYLNLNSNNMSGDITEITFSSIRNSITTLDFTKQNITGIRNEAFADMETLLSLNLSKNSIKTLNDSSFVNTYIRILDLSYNQLQDLNFLKNCLTNLTVFNVSNNNIQVISQNAFENQQQMVNLDLSMNNIIRIEQTSLPLLKLQYLNVAGNHLYGAVRMNVFSPAKYLRFLDLSNLNITRIDDYAFVDLPVLAGLNLSHNQIGQIKLTNFRGVNNMHSLDISYNKLLILRIPIKMANLTALYLNNNKLKDVSKLFRDPFYVDISRDVVPSLTTLNLAHNNIQNFNNRRINTLSTLKELKLSSNELSTVNLSYFKDLKSIDLSNNHLTSINSMFRENVENIESLDLSRNNITFLQPGTFQFMENLKVLNLSANSLTEIRNGSLQGLNNTQVMDISKNALTSLNAELFKKCNELTTLIIDDNLIKSLHIDRLLFLVPKLSTISLGGNPIFCRNFFLRIGPVNSSVSVRRVVVTSIDKIYHGDNVYGIKCGDNDTDVNTNKPEADSAELSSVVPLVLWPVLTILLISIGALVIYKKYHNNNRIRVFPVDRISKSSLEVNQSVSSIIDE